MAWTPDDGLEPASPLRVVAYLTGWALVYGLVPALFVIYIFRH